MTDDTIFIADANFFIEGNTVVQAPHKIYTTQDALDEVRDRRSAQRLDLVKMTHEVIAKEPSNESFEVVVKTATDSGNVVLLSRTDMRLIALALDFQPEDAPEEETEPDYPVTFFFTKEGYFKKITPQSLRISGEQKLKEGDEISQIVEGSNNSDLLFFSQKSKVYKLKGSSFQDGKASTLGEFIGAKVSADEDEKIVYMSVTKNYNGFMIFFFEDGRAAKVEMKSYFTKTNRKKLLNAFSGSSPLVKCFYLLKDSEFMLISSSGKAIVFKSSLLSLKSLKSTMGVHVMTLKKGHRLIKVQEIGEKEGKEIEKYRVKNIPAVGINYTPKNSLGEQLSF